MRPPGISPATVADYRKALYKALGVGSAGQAVARCHECGLLPVTGPG